MWAIYLLGLYSLVATGMWLMLRPGWGSKSSEPDAWGLYHDRIHKEVGRGGAAKVPSRPQKP